MRPDNRFRLVVYTVVERAHVCCMVVWEWHWHCLQGYLQVVHKDVQPWGYSDLVSSGVYHFVLEQKHIYGEERITKTKVLEPRHVESTPIKILSKSKGIDDGILKLILEANIDLKAHAVIIAFETAPSHNIAKVARLIARGVASIQVIEVVGVADSTRRRIPRTRSARYVARLASVVACRRRLVEPHWAVVAAGVVVVECW